MEQRKAVSSRLWFGTSDSGWFSTFSFIIFSVADHSVALTPAATAALIKKGFSVQVEDGAGFDATFHNDAYKMVGASIVDARTARESDILLKVRQPHDTEIPLFRDNSTVISFLHPAQNKPLIDKLAAKKMNAFGMCCEMIINNYL